MNATVTRLLVDWARRSVVQLSVFVFVHCVQAIIYASGQLHIIPLALVALVSTQTLFRKNPGSRVIVALPVCTRDRSFYLWASFVGLPGVVATLIDILSIAIAFAFGALSLTLAAIVQWLLTTWALIGLAVLVSIAATTLRKSPRTIEGNYSFASYVVSIPYIVAFLGLPDTQSSLWQPFFRGCVVVGIVAVIFISMQSNVLLRLWPDASTFKKTKIRVRKNGWLRQAVSSNCLIFFLQQSMRGMAASAGISVGVTVLWIVLGSFGLKWFDYGRIFSTICYAMIIYLCAPSIVAPLVATLLPLRLLPMGRSSLAALLCLSAALPILLLFALLSGSPLLWPEIANFLPISLMPLLVAPRIYAIVAFIKAGIALETQKTAGYFFIFLYFALLEFMFWSQQGFNPTLVAQRLLLVFGTVACVVGYVWMRHEVAASHNAYKAQPIPASENQ